MLIVFGMLQSKTWGWITPRSAPEINGHTITPLGISVVAYLILLGVVVLKLFFNRQKKLLLLKRQPLLDPTLLSIKPLRSGLSVLLSQYALTAGVFFIIPVFLQMTLGYDALKTGIKIFPLSVAVILFSIIGTKLSRKLSPKKIIRAGQIILIAGSILLLWSISSTLKGWLFGSAMFLFGGALGLLASQIGNVTMSSVQKQQSSEVGGLQGVFQNLGSSLGTALIGSVMISSLSTTFNTGIQESTLPSGIKSSVSTQSQAGIEIVPISQVNSIASAKGVSQSDANQIEHIYSESQVGALSVSIYALLVIAVLSLLFSKNIPDTITK